MYRPVPPPPPALSPGGQKLAEFTDRLVAYIVDGAILGAVIAVVAIPVYFYAFFALFDDLPNQIVLNQERITVEPTPAEVWGAFLPLLGVMALLIVYALAVTYLYQVELMFRSGQTIGKRIMKIRTVPLDPGGALTRGMAFRRFLVQYGVAQLVPFFAWLDGLWQLWDKPHRQCLHDKWATTVVIKLDT